MGSTGSSTQLQRLLDLLQAGHDSARDALLQHNLEQLRHLARCMFRRRGNLRKLDETDDVLQKAMIRLHRALAQIKPPNSRAFFALAAQQVRWVLLDLAREAAAAKVVVYSGGRVSGSNPEEEEPMDPADGPGDLLEWRVFHETIGTLPDEEREMFDLLLYQGLPQADAATVLGVSLRTVKRRWQRARLLLRDALHGQWPGEP
jgi:RNA polymerase sigma-70 factor (ECF subfamily)